jgi:hypothetical protein
LFIIYGACTLFLGVIVLVALPDHPEKAWFFNAEEKKLFAVRMAENQTNGKTDKVCLPPNTAQGPSNSDMACIRGSNGHISGRPFVIPSIGLPRWVSFAMQ